MSLAWIASGLTAALLWAEFLTGTLHPRGWPFVALAAVAIGATLATAILGVWRVAMGPSRARAFVWTVVGLVPAGLVAALVLDGAAQYRRGQIGRTVPFIAFAMAGTSLAEIEAPWRYPHRLTSEHLIMVYDDRIADPRGDLEAMERHVADLVRRTKRPLRSKILWVRGPLLGQRSIAIGGFALASDSSPAREVDRHELAHAVMFQAMSPATDPPMLLAEGWAESQSRGPVELAERALMDRRTVANLARKTDAEVAEIVAGWADPEGYTMLARRAREAGPRGLPLVRELLGPEWYHRDRGSVYHIGGAFADHLVRRYGADQFLGFYLAARPGRMDEASRALSGRSLDDLEADFWRECERLARGLAR